MLTVYSLRDHRIIPHQVSAADQLHAETLWVDLIRPSDEERRWVKDAYAQELPSTASMVEIEASSRFYEDEHGLHLHSYFLQQFPDGLRNVTVGFLLSGRRLFTLHDEPLLAFDHVIREGGQRTGFVRDAHSVVLRLFAAQVDGVADALECLYGELDTRGTGVVRATEQDIEGVVTHMAGVEDVNIRARLSLMDNQRVLSHFLRSGKVPHSLQPDLNEILRDVESLTAHSTFLSEKSNFVMDITMGRVNVQQNKVVKLLSIAATVFLPPTLVASIYGMNFRFMPELHWTLGLLVSAVVPYWYSKRKGWL
jgi:magnesium transporter